MPPKQAKGPTRGKGDEVKEDPLQAVIVADTFEAKFAPLSLDKPRCLLPLASTPLIEYTLEYLASAGVDEVFLYASAHVDQVETYINASRWKSSSSPFSRLDIIRCMATSVGDIMRDLDQKQLMVGDFLCVSGDIVSDFPMSRALKAHKERRDKDKNAIMTMLLRERTESDQRHAHQTVPTFVIDPTKDRCLHYEEGAASAGFGAHIEVEILKSPELDVRQDLIDCRIDICTPDVLSLWSDNFDNQRPRKDFLFGVLKDYELNGKTIHTYIVDESYANRVDDPYAYATIAADLQKSTSSGLAFDNNLAGTRFTRKRGNVLREDDVIVQRPGRLGRGTIAGEGTSIAAGTIVQRSVLGKRCQVGKKTQITAAFIWDDVTIGSNVVITRAIVGSEAFVADNCIIGEGALIADGVKVAAETTVPPGARVCNSSSAASSKGNGPISTNSTGAYFEDEDEDEGYDPAWPRSLYGKPEFNESTSSIASDASEISASLSHEGSRSQSFATHASDEDDSGRFLHDTVAILVQRMQDNQKVDDMQSELMGLRFSGGADEGQVRKSVAIALMKYVLDETRQGRPVAQASRTTLETYKHLIRRPNAERSVPEQIEFLFSAQKELAHREEGAKIMPFVVKDLYDLEIFEEEAFTSWYEDPKAAEGNLEATRAAVAPFIEWLENADEESDEEDEEDSSEDE